MIPNYSSKHKLLTFDLNPGNPYGEDVVEAAPRLQGAVLTLSAGPVAVGDKIGLSDVDLIMRSCRAVSS